jgi:hypothetical protein
MLKAAMIDTNIELHSHSSMASGKSESKSLVASRLSPECRMSHHAALRVIDTVCKAVRALPTLCLVGMLAVAVSGQSLWVSYTLPPCESKEPARFYISTGGAYVGQVAVISITSKQALITDPNRQENPYRPTIAKGAVIQPGGMAQNITFDPRAMPDRVEVRVTLPIESQSLQGTRFELESLCRK